MDTILTPKNAQKFHCESCHFVCSKESDWVRHKSTRKHTKSYNRVTSDDNCTQQIARYECKCGNNYIYRQGLYKHRKTCFVAQEDNDKTNIATTIDKNDITQKLVELIMSKNQEFITELVSTITSSNKEVMEKMLEIMPQVGNNSHNHMNSHNNNFNIQMFLNEHCKNAMNLTDFIDSLPITAETYDSTIENGLTKTITSMLVNGLSKLDILDRPIHCTDATRKTLYVKDDDTWEKDNELLHILKGIKTLSMKQRTMINKWQDANLGWDTKENLQSRLTRLVYNSMTSIESDDKETGKIIRAVSKNVYLDNDTKDHYITQSS
jgi:hypothetical protein